MAAGLNPALLPLRTWDSGIEQFISAKPRDYDLEQIRVQAGAMATFPSLSGDVLHPRICRVIPPQ
jgi:hypothetical protein